MIELSEKKNDVLQYLCRHFDPLNRPPTYKEIAAGARVSRAYVRPALKALKARGLITWRGGKTETIGLISSDDKNVLELENVGPQLGSLNTRIDRLSEQLDELLLALEADRQVRARGLRIKMSSAKNKPFEMWINTPCDI